MNFAQPHEQLVGRGRERLVVVAVIALFYAVGYWNTWFMALLFLPGKEKWPLQQVLYTYTYRGNPMPGTGTTNTGRSCSSTR